MSNPTRISVKVILLNEQNELLLLRTDDPKTKAIQGNYRGRFWQMVGGAIEKGEITQQAALREIFEETGMQLTESNLGPVVWRGAFDLVLGGMPTHIQQSFIVAKTNKQKLSLNNLTEYEKEVIDKLAWFSLEEILHTDEIIYPVVLKEYLPDILAGIYPQEPLEIDLAKQHPARK